MQHAWEPLWGLAELPPTPNEGSCCAPALVCLCVAAVHTSFCWMHTKRSHTKPKPGAEGDLHIDTGSLQPQWSSSSASSVIGTVNEGNKAK